jgi:hypothetical protein
MTTTMRAAMATLMFFLAACGGACAGYQARQHALLPAMQQAWGGELGIRAQAERSAALEADPALATAAVATADEAIQDGTAAKMAAAPWQVVDDLAAADIARRITAGEISMGVGDSLRERLLQFQRSRAAMIQEVGQ